MTNDLEAFFQQSEPEITAAVEQAEMELAALRVRVMELERLIGRGRTVLGSPEQPQRDLTLHRALEFVLAESDNAWMSARDLAHLVSHRGLYRMKDGRPVEAGQIHARVRNYEHFFELDSGKIRLRYVFETSEAPATGAFAAARTAIVPADLSDWEMTVEARVAYGVVPPDGHSLESYASEKADELAHRLVSKDTFVPGGEISYLLTTTGLEILERSW